VVPFYGTIIISSKGKNLILYLNYTYYIKLVNKNFVKWRCSKRQCKAIERTELNYKNNLSSFQLIAPHDHEADISASFK
jgi:hypothetical protein